MTHAERELLLAVAEAFAETAERETRLRLRGALVAVRREVLDADLAEIATLGAPWQ